MNLLHTRAIIDAIHDGSLENSSYVADPIFGLKIPKTCPHVPEATLQPRLTWANPEEYDVAARKLAGLFRENFKQYYDQASPEIRSAGPLL
jgi:phosphoenolpyruvate carboxykinase (ATP)